MQMIILASLSPATELISPWLHRTTTRTPIDSGRVYIFNPATGELISTIANPSPNGGDFFSRLSFSGNTLIVGAPTDDSDGSNAGMVYLFDLPFDQVVGSLSTTDPDAGSVLTYSLVRRLPLAASKSSVTASSSLIRPVSTFESRSNAHDSSPRHGPRRPLYGGDVGDPDRQ